MFGLFKKKTEPPARDNSGLRELLFGDVPLDQWSRVAATPAPQAVPWSHFVRAEQCLRMRDERGAQAALGAVLATPGLESRQYLQAWHGLRELKLKPSVEDARRVFGVIVEVHLNAGLDVVAAYADHSARYLNHSGASVLIESETGVAHAEIARLVEAAQVAVSQLEVWKGPRPAAPSRGRARINILTAAGLHFGEGPMDALFQDSLGGPIMSAALAAMTVLTDGSVRAKV